MKSIFVLKGFKPLYLDCHKLGDIEHNKQLGDWIGTWWTLFSLLCCSICTGKNGTVL